MVKLRKEGMRQVPAVYALDWEKGWCLMEWVEGGSVKDVLRVVFEGEKTLPRSGEGIGEADKLEQEEDAEKEGKKRFEEEREGRLMVLMAEVGGVVGKCHERGVCHGDLTTSNLMVRDIRPASFARPHSSLAMATEACETELYTPMIPSTKSPEVILIDFGLAAQSTQDEDRAVDLYVLERAFGSTHPQAERLWNEVLRAYGDSYKGAKIVVKRLAEVRMRGRKKIMIG